MMKLRYTLLTGILLATGACGGDDEGGTTPDAGVDGATFDAADEPDATTGTAARGEYLVKHVMACDDCHSPRTETGMLDETRLLSGVDCLFDVDPKSEGAGCLSSANLTNHATGLMTRSDAEILTMLRDGTRPDGSALFDVMPYYLFHNLTDSDALSIVLYLRTVTGVDHVAAANQAPFDTRPPAPTRPLADAELPTATGGGEAAARGRYLAGFPCIDCHTKTTAPGSAFPLDLTVTFGGGRDFPRAALGLPDFFPEVIYTANLTPHATGIENYTIEEIKAVLLQGTDRGGNGVCPPMPVGPDGPFGGLTDGDATDIATYIKNLPPVDNAIPNGCSVPTEPPPVMSIPLPNPHMNPGYQRGFARAKAYLP